MPLGGGFNPPLLPVPVLFVPPLPLLHCCVARHRDLSLAALHPHPPTSPCLPTLAPPAAAQVPLPCDRCPLRCCPVVSQLLGPTPSGCRLIPSSLLHRPPDTSRSLLASAAFLCAVLQLRNNVAEQTNNAAVRSRSAVSLPPRHSCSLVPHPPVAHCACVLLVNLALPPPGRTLSCWLQSAIERRSKSTSLASCLHPPLPCHILPSIYTLDGPLSPLSIPPLLNPIPRSRLCLPSVYATILRRLNTRCRVLHPPGWSSSIGS